MVLDEDRTVELPAESESVDRLWQWLEAWGARLRWGAPLLGAMRLCAEEAATNIIRHAFAATQGKPAFRVTLGTDGDEARLTFEDEGVPFDPTAYAEPARGDRLEDLVVGGLGIRLMRGSARSLRYERAGDTNRLILTFGPTGAAAASSARS